MGNYKGTHGAGSYFGPRCSCEPTDQEWKETMDWMNKRGPVQLVDGKPWTDPGVGKTTLGDGSPARSAVLDEIIRANRLKRFEG